MEATAPEVTADLSGLQICGAISSPLFQQDELPEIQKWISIDGKEGAYIRKYKIMGELISHPTSFSHGIESL